MRIDFKCLLVWVLWLVALVSSLGAYAADTTAAGRTRYLYCNVFANPACFGIASGDKLRMEIVTDFVVYDVESSDGWHAKIYFGFNPTVVDQLLKDVRRSCVDANAPCVKVAEGIGGVELLYFGSSDQPAMHLILSGVDPDNIETAREFIANFRPCTRTASRVECDDHGIAAVRFGSG